MLEKYESPQINMYPIDSDTYWRVMRQHKLELLKKAQPLENKSKYFPTTQYNYYRYFLENGVNAKYWVPMLIINDIESIYDNVDGGRILLMPDTGQVEKIISSIG